MDKKQVTKLIGKIKETVGENNYKLALAITGHRTGKIKDIIMCSKDGELLLEYVEHLEQQCNKQKEAINKIIEIINYYGVDKEYNDNVILRHILKDMLDILKRCQNEYI